MPCCCCCCWESSVHIMISTNHKFACFLNAFSFLIGLIVILYSTLMIPCIILVSSHMAAFQMGPYVKPSYRFIKWISFEERLMWRRGRFGSIGKFIQTRSTIWQPMPLPLLSHVSRYYHTKYIQRLNMREMFLGRKYKCKFSAKHIFQQGFLSHVLLA